MGWRLWVPQGCHPGGGRFPGERQSSGQSPPLPRPRRCADAEAYELSQGELSNGIFVTFLKRWLLEDEKITVLLDKVAEGEWGAAGDGESPPAAPADPPCPSQTWARWRSHGAGRRWSSAATSQRDEP